MENFNGPEDTPSKTLRMPKKNYCLDLGGSTFDFVEISQNPEISTQYTITECKSIESSLFSSFFLAKHNKSKTRPPLNTDKLLNDIIEEFGKRKAIQSQKILTITGGRSQKFPDYFILGGEKIQIRKIPEFEAIARGGAFLSQKKSGLVVSLGTGTAMISIQNIAENKWKHVRGTGIGGGTFLGLGQALLGIKKFSDLQKISQEGNLKNIDISVGDIVGGSIGNLTPDMTASNFGKFSPEVSTKADIALSLANLVGQSIASLAIEKAKVHGHQTIILGGKISRFPVITECIKKTAKFFNIEIIIPKNSGYMTAIGGAIIEENINEQLYSKYSQQHFY